MTDSAAGLRVSVVQFEAVPSDKAGNLATVRRLAEEAVAGGTQLVIFPEMCLLAYWHLTKTTVKHLRELAEPADGPLVRALIDLAAELGVGIGAGFLESDGDPLYNSYAVCFPDGTVHVHRKLHAFEHAAISSGDRFTVFDTPWGVRMAILICWDNNLVENVRAVTLLGAKVLIAPHQTGGTSSRSPHGMKVIPSELWHNRANDPEALRDAVNGPYGRGWLMRWLPSRAHDNGIFLLFSNGIGPDDDEIRTGNAMIIDPYGRIIAETPVADESVVTADLDLDLLPLSTGRRWLLGRRPELYGVLTQRSGLERDARAARHSDAPVPDDFQIEH
ncbi:nitrilase-related carbon-nitrogen hydrolase [Microbacterium murale]|uniref:Amidohydrolase n=1 Tax=Microbacterium murale TaxID=1081040 RepID=A0ABU0P747_9MICO|nr:nitrilase-related carbon-nitrogen hydrolase [Microbacterium murale]MDQ0643163.1 putative amidohydrolase [Microbacterium murale]